MIYLFVGECKNKKNLHNTYKNIFCEYFNNNFAHIYGNIKFLDNPAYSINNGYISISHTNKYIFISYCKSNPCGIDAEYMLKWFKAVDKYKNTNTVYPYNIYKWTMMEAFLKLHNKPIGVDYYNNFNSYLPTYYFYNFYKITIGITPSNFIFYTLRLNNCIVNICTTIYCNVKIINFL